MIFRLPLLLLCASGGLSALAGGCGNSDPAGALGSRSIAEPRSPSAAAVPAPAVPAEELRRRAQVLFLELGGDLAESRRVSLGELCPDPLGPPALLCPTLEQALALDGCHAVAVGCGLWQVKLDGVSYWYDGFGSQPVGVSTSGQADGPGPWAATRSLGCDALSTVCSTCGRGSTPVCENEPGWLPETPAPVPVPGCACEEDAAGDRQVSLDCFCSIYPCPRYEALLRDCPPEAEDENYRTVQATWACDRVWLATAAYSGQRFAYDRLSQQLVAAVAFSNGPVTAPCGSYRVWAGDPGSCSEPRACRCNGVHSAYLIPPERGEVPDACEGTDWFTALLSEQAVLD